jgi:cell wall-associated NlpC family hydrolase
MKQLGYAFPLHDLPKQAASGKQIDKSQLQAGDLVFFQNTYTKGISHVGIFIGEDQFISAAAENVGVVKSKFSDKYWASHYLSSTRPFAK